MVPSASSSSLRETVLRAAVDHIAVHGPDGLSFRQLAAEAGVSHQAPYHHFADRKGIFLAITREGFTLFTEALRKAVDEAGDPSSMLETYVEFALQHRGHFKVMFRSDLSCVADDDEVREIAEESFGVLVDYVAQTLGPRASVEQVRNRATAMWGVAHGIATLMIDGPLETMIGEVTDRRAFLRGIASEMKLGKSR